MAIIIVITTWQAKSYQAKQDMALQGCAAQVKKLFKLERIATVKITILAVFEYCLRYHYHRRSF